MIVKTISFSMSLTEDNEKNYFSLVFSSFQPSSYHFHRHKAEEYLESCQTYAFRIILEIQLTTKSLFFLFGIF